MSTGNQEYIRDMNRALVLEAIANHPPLSRADLAKMLHLTKQPYPPSSRNCSTASSS